MLWLKRNLFMALGGAIALVLLGLAGFYLFSNYSKESAVKTELSMTTEALKALKERKPSFPNKVNIDATKKESERVMNYWNSGTRFLVGGGRGPRNRLDTAEYKKLLANTLFDLTKRAASTGVTLQTNYTFTFQKQMSAVQFSPGSIEPLVSELEDIKGMCEILFDSKISALSSMRRIPVGDESLGDPEYLSKTVQTNLDSGTTIWSYEITFVGFTADLAEALSGLAKAPHCYIVKSVTVSPAQKEPAVDAMGVPLAAVATAPSGLDLAIQARYGPRGGARGVSPDRPPFPRGGGTPPPLPSGMVAPPAPAPAPVSRTPTIVLEEKPLQITLYVEVVKQLVAARP